MSKSDNSLSALISIGVGVWLMGKGEDRNDKDEEKKDNKNYLITNMYLATGIGLMIVGTVKFVACIFDS